MANGMGRSKKDLAEVAKGFSHAKRINILLRIAKTPDMSLEEISANSEIPYKTAAVHIRRLERSGLIRRKRENQHVNHSITPLGEQVLEFLSSL